MRGGNLAGLTIATVCGIATAYTTFQPALQEEAEKRAGTFELQHEGDSSNKNEGGKSRREEKDTQLSRAILNDLKEAKREVIGEDRGTGGFAWGIRKWLFGSKERQHNDAMDEARSRGDQKLVADAPGMREGKEDVGKK